MTLIEGTGSYQRVNWEMANQLGPHFVGSREYMLSRLRLEEALRWPTPEGGAALRYAWDAQRWCIDALGDTLALTATNVAVADHAVTAQGAPYVDLDGSTEYLHRAQGTFSDIGANSFAVWAWATVSAAPGSTVIYNLVGVWGAAGHRQWRLRAYNDGAGTTDLAWITSDDGTATSAVACSAAFPANNTWFFLGGYFIPSTADGQRCYYGLATADDLTIDDLGGGNSDALIYAGGSAEFAIGAQSGGSNYWNGRASVNGGRSVIANADADKFMLRMFRMAKALYGG